MEKASYINAVNACGFLSHDQLSQLTPAIGFNKVSLTLGVPISKILPRWIMFPSEKSGASPHPTIMTKPH